MELNNAGICWDCVTSGTMVKVNWPEAFNPRFRNFEAPFIGVDSQGFIVLEVNLRDDLYDGFPPNVCSIK